MTVTAPHIPPASTLHLPRILCLHGGATNALIFYTQLRSFMNHPSLTSRFRFVFAEAPFECDPAPAILPVYAGCGPYRRWLRWLPGQDEIEDELCREAVVGCIRQMMKDDDERGAIGEWVGILGFSQGGKVAVSLLYEMQIAEERRGEDKYGLDFEGRKVNWRFSVVMAGRAPLVALSELTEGLGWFQKAGGLADEMDWNAVTEGFLQRPEMKLRVPTVHVHGLKDEGLVLHRKLVDEYCAPGTAMIVEWDGNHRVPLKKGHVEKVVEAIVQLADEYGI